MSEGGSFKEKVFWESDGMGGESNLNLTFCGQLISNLMKQQYLDGEEWLNFGDRVYIDDQVKFTWGVRGPPLPPLPSVCFYDCVGPPYHDLEEMKASVIRKTPSVVALLSWLIIQQKSLSAAVKGGYF